MGWGRREPGGGEEGAGVGVLWGCLLHLDRPSWMIVWKGPCHIHLHTVSVLLLFPWCLDKSYCLKLVFQLTGFSCLVPGHREWAGLAAFLLWCWTLGSLYLSSVCRLRTCLRTVCIPCRGRIDQGRVSVSGVVWISRIVVLRLLEQGATIKPAGGDSGEESGPMTVHF
jgi:hypothetical protein